ncbi:MAG: hypothetical protein GXP14_12025, partial [Gammaproteobacteria bacterium]|nr:hypothetical protein [Gammaproteobacteria bacterium]
MDRCLMESIERLQSCKELLEVKEALVSIKEKLDFDNVLYAIKLPNTFTRSSAFIVSDYPREWLERYANEGYVNIDPVARHCFSSPEPYHWNCFKTFDQKEIKVFAQEAHDFRLHDGISIGMSGFHGETSLLSLASETALDSNSDK